MKCVSFDVNLKGSRAGQYTNYTFNSMVNFNGEFLGANNFGIFRLSGNLDNATPIPGEFQLVTTDLGISNPKRMYSVYIGFEAAKDLLLTVTADDKPAKSYVIPAKLTGQQVAKVKLGRNLHGRYWTFNITNPSGGFFAIDSIDVLPMVRNRNLNRKFGG